METNWSLSSHWIQTKDFNIHVRSSNKQANAQNLVLIHGLGISGRYFVPLGEILARVYNVYIPDLPGFGKSSKPSYVLNVRELSNALFSFIDASNIQQFVLLGNSFGCQIIVDYIVQYPASVFAAILVGPTVESSKRSIRQQLLGWLKNSTKEPLSQLPIYH